MLGFEYLTSVRGEPSRTMNGVFTQSGEARDLGEIPPGVYPEFAEGVEMTAIPNFALLREEYPSYER